VTSNDGARTPVDLELIADYLDGLLLGAEAEMVARRIATDPRWAYAAGQLRSAQPVVTDVLRSAGAATEPMPDAVLERILAALPEFSDRVEQVPAAAAAVPEPRRQARAIPLADRRRRRTVLWENFAKVAAALVVVGGIGTGIALGTQHSSNTSAGSNAPAAASLGAKSANAAGITTESTGHDYGTDLGVGPLPSSAALGSATDGNTVAPRATGGLGSIPVPQAAAPLDRLAKSGLPACIAAVERQFGATPSLADFAYYKGQPAVIFRLSDNKVVAVGPQCGLTGADVLATAG
jgi:anti-sigma factor RsiW